jgi:hypothetical protein
MGKENDMIELTQQQHEAIQNGTKPVRAIDRATNTEYVLIRREVYERLSGILDEDDSRLMEPLLAELDAEDWEDASAYPGNP